MTYTWSTFNLQDALAGTLVGFKKTNNWDLSETGLLKYVGSKYMVVINGHNLEISSSGAILNSTPSGYSGTLQMVTASMGSTGAVGTDITRSSGESGDGHNAIAVLNNIEPRDQFAVQVLNAMLINADHPESFDDAKCLMFSRAAYRWAQAMMIAAADSREGESTEPSTAVNVNSGDLQSNTEKLLYNIGEYLKNGVTVKGTTAEGTVPVQTKITEMPNVTLNGTPSVNVSNMPSEPIEVQGTVSVDNFPSAE